MRIRASAPSVKIAAFGASLAAAATALAVFVFPHFTIVPQRLHISFFIIAAGFAITERFAIHVEVGENAHSISLTELPLFVGLFFCAPVQVLLARLVGGLLVIVWVKRQSNPLKIAFNAGHFAFEASVAATVFHVLRAGLPFGSLRSAWVAAIAASIITNAASATEITLVIRLATGRTEPRAFRTMAVGSVIASVATTSLALMTITLLLSDSASIALVGIVAVVLFIAYRGYTSLRQRYSNLHHLYDFTRDLAGSTETDPTIRATLSRSCELMRAGSGELCLTDGESVITMTYMREDESLTAVAGLPRADDWPGARARAERTAVLLAQGSKEDGARRYLDARGHKDMIIAPLINGDTILGTISVFDRLGEVSTFDTEDMKVFEALANHASVSLENGRLIDRLRQEAAERAHQATHDSLTNLGNRRLFAERVTETLNAGERAAVLLLDLNRFKDVNDSLGHHFGDGLLKEVARRLTIALPHPVTIARLGGDEFALLVRGITDDAAATDAADLVLRALDRPFSVEGLNLVISAAVGVAISPDHGTDANVLLQHADVAMYAAKDARSQEPRVYSKTLDQGAARRLALAAELREALDARELMVYYQPKAVAGTKEICGMEALLRWRRDDGTWVPPDEFIPVAEHVGLIRPLTMFVLREAIQQARAWRDAGTPVSVSVNLSAQSLLDGGLASDVEQTLREHALEPELVIFEITESQVMSDPERTIDTLDALRAIGVGLSVDDFGTGHSSLSYLQRLPVQEVKIDKSFVLKMTANEGDAAIVRSIIDLGRNLKLHVVAEGVEDQPAWDTLAALGCEMIQGYFLSKPMPAQDTAGWLDSHSVRRARTDSTVRPLRPRSA